jgi:phage terminase large subunit-like protein
VSEDQTANTYRALLGMVAEGSSIVTNYGLDVGVTKVMAPGGGLIEPVTAAAGTREGQRVTFAVLDETHLWDKTSKGTALAATIRRNVAKMDGRTFESTNAWEPGRDSVAEKTANAAEQKRPGILFDHRTYDGEFSLSNKVELRKAIRHVYGEAAKPRAWIDANRIIAEVHDPATTEADARRFYLNEVCAPPDQWVTEAAWESLSATVAPEPLEEITAGFVGRAYQGAALIACRITTGELWTVKTWETAGDDLVSRSEVHAAVESLFDGFTVRRFYVNPQEWASEYDAWALAWGEDVVISRPPQQTANQAYAVDRFRTAIGAGTLQHDGNEVLRRHILGAQTKTVAAGTLIIARTEAPADQITAAKAAVLAWEARADVLTVIEEGPSVYEERGMVTLG